MINTSAYTKRMENVRNRIDVRPLANSKGNQKLVSKPNFLPKKISNKCFVAVHIIKEVNQRLRYLSLKNMVIVINYWLQTKENLT